MEGTGQKFRFNYVEISALKKSEACLCLELVIEIFSNYKIKEKKKKEVKEA